MLKSIFRRLSWPIKEFYIRRLKGNQKKWRNRDLISTKKYWKNRHSPSNQFLYDILSKFHFESACEIGCNCGNRLYQIAKENPHIYFSGIDINKIAIEYGNRSFKDSKINNVILHHTEASDLNFFSDKSFDVVFSWATFIYIPPDQINSVLDNIIRIAKKGIILIETHDNLLIEHREKYGVLLQPGNWKRNYTLLLKDRGIQSEQIHTEEVPKDVWSPGGGYAKAIIVTFS